MSKIKITGIVFLLGTITVLLINACKKDDDEGTATIHVQLKDAPGDFQQVNVDVVDVELHTSSGGWQNVAVNDSIYDLLLLQDSANALLGTLVLPASNLSQLRLILGSQNTVMVDSIVHPLSLSSQDETGLKLNINQNLVPGGVYTLVIDFDANSSVVLEGNGTYKLKPVLTASFD